MKNKFQLLFILLTIIIVSFPPICLSEMKTIEGEYCDVYLGDMKNKKELGKFKKSVREKSIEYSLSQLFNTPGALITHECMVQIISQYLEKVVVVSHKENGRKICDKVKITSDPDVLNLYISQKSCELTLTIFKGWVEDIYYGVLTKKSDKINIGLVIEIKIPDIERNKKEQLENEEEKQFFDMIEKNKDKYKYVDRRHLKTILEEQKFSSFGLTENETVKLGKLLNLDIIVLRLIYEDSRVTKVLKVDTGEVLLFKTYKTE